jgi:hypothetical protein
MTAISRAAAWKVLRPVIMGIIKELVEETEYADVVCKSMGITSGNLERQRMIPGRLELLSELPELLDAKLAGE